MAEKEFSRLTGDVPLPENVERLLRHLEDGSLADWLVRAHHAERRNGKREVMTKVLQMRLRRARATLNAADD